MRKHASRLAFAATAGLALLAGVTCADNSLTGPTSRLRAVVQFFPSFTDAATDVLRRLTAFQLQLDNIHLVLKYQDGSVAKDTVIAIGPNDESISIELAVPLAAPEELLKAFLDLRDGEQVLFSGTQQIRARRGGLSETPPPLPISYSGPGAAAVDLTVSPLDTTILSTDSLTLRTAATDAAGQPVSNLLIAWAVKDGANGTVSDAGLFRPSIPRGNTWVIARLPNGVADSARVHFVPVPSQLVLVSGGGQTGIVGRALEQPIVVEVRGSDNLPLTGIAVSFAVAGGGGSVLPEQATTDANGRASASFRMGSLTGTNTLRATVGTVGAVTPLEVTATAGPTAPGALELAVAPATTARAGVPLTLQPTVLVRDSLGNVVPTAGLTIQASLVSGAHTLGGTTTATTNADGRATFTGLRIDGPIGSAQLRFALASPAVEVTSGLISLGAGYARALAITQQPSATAMSGVALAAQPRVALRDAFGNPVPADGIPVTASLSPADGRTLAGTPTVNTGVDGVASFTNLSITGIAGTARLAFAGPDSITAITSADIVLGSGVATVIAPVNPTALADTAGANVTGALLPVVIARDASNNPVPGVEVKFRRHGGAGAQINGVADTMVLVTTDANGVAALTSRRLQTLVGTDTVLVTAGSLPDTLEFVAAVTNATATQLVFLQQPTNTTAGATITPGVALRDQYGNHVTSGAGATANVTLALAGGTAGAVLGGTTTVAASGGLAGFSVSVDLAGTGYVLQASTATIALVSSSPFDVSIGAGAALSVVSGDGQGALAGDLLPLPLVVRVADQGGNPVPGTDVIFAVDSGGGMFADQSTVTTVTSGADGMATVTWQVGSGQQRVAVVLGTDTTFMRAYVASQLAIVTEPTLTPASGAALVTQPVVRLVDAAGNAVRRSGVPIATELDRVPLVDAFMELTGVRVVVTNAEGVATFTDLTLTGQTIQPVQIRFFRELNAAPDPAITQVNTQTITVQPGAAAEIVSSEFQVHHLLNAAGTRTVGVQVSDVGGWNRIAGAPVTFQLQSGACLLSTAAAATDANGIATVDVNISGTAASCVVEGRTSAIATEGAQVLHRVYVAPAGMAVWTGALDGTSFAASQNWLGGVPGPTTDVFIPRAAAFGAFPHPSGRTSLNSMIIESEALFNITRDTLVLNDSLIANGIVNGADATVIMLGQGLSPSVRGNVQAKLILGNVLDAVSCDGQYHPRGTLVVDSLQVDCNFYQLANETVTVRGAARVTGTGFWDLRTGSVTVGGDLSVETASGFLGAELHIGDATLEAGRKLVVTPESALGQNGGTITVRDTAVFDGDQMLWNGVLNLLGAFRHTGNGDTYRLDGRLPHVTRFAGARAGTDTMRLHWDAPSGGTVPSTFGQLEFNTTGEAGVTFFTSLAAATVLAGHTIVRPNAFLFIPGGQAPRYGLTTGTANRSGTTGLIVETGGRITNDGQIIVLNNTTCVLTGIITTISCLTP